MLIVGADTRIGKALTEAVAGRGEVRVFVSDEAVADVLRQSEFKVALGDVSDPSHIGGAAIGAFSAVLLAEAATDDRVRSFAVDPTSVVAAWIDAVADAGVRRIILVGGAAEEALLSGVAAGVETAFVDTHQADASSVVARVVALDEARDL